LSVEDGIPEGGQATPEPAHDWERDYKALQAEYTRSQQELKAWEDEPTALQRFAEKYPHLMAPEDDDTPDPEPDYEQREPMRDPRFDEIAPTVQQLVAWRAEEQYARDLNDIAGDRSLSEKAKRTIKSWTTEGGNNRQALEAAVKEWIEFEDELRGPQRKPAPTPPQPGKAAEIDRNALQDPAERRKARRAQIAAQIEAGTQ
jgi:hypothetical protein